MGKGGKVRPCSQYNAGASVTHQSEYTLVAASYSEPGLRHTQKLK